MICVFSLLVLLNAAPVDARADFTMSGPAVVKTAAEIVACAEKDDLQGGLRKEPNVSTAEYRCRDLKAFIAWYSPYSGRSDCHLYVYVYSDTREVWIRKVATLVQGTSGVSVELGDAITIRDIGGKAIRHYAVAALAEPGNVGRLRDKVDCGK